MSHIPVLLKKVIQYLDPKPGDFVIDGTIGSAGHAVEILKRILPDGKLLGTDLDGSLLKKVESKISTELKIKNSELRKNLILKQGNYADLPEILRRPDLVSWIGAPTEASGLPKADGLLIDLGFSSEQLESRPARHASQGEAGRGFSFQKDEVLDMRYGPEGQTAAEVVNSLPEKDLANIFWKYGEERYSRQIAKRIVEERKKERILMTGRLVEIIKSAVPKNYEKGRINPGTRVFQALRIYINDELGNLARILGNLEEILKNKGRTSPLTPERRSDPPASNRKASRAGGGRVVIISFHSLEDRIVKNFFRQSAKEGKMEILTKKPVVAQKEEIEINPRSRSAKMRAAKLK